MKITLAEAMTIITDRHYAGRPGIDLQIELAWQRRSPLLLIRLGSKHITVDFHYDTIEFAGCGDVVARITRKRFCDAVEWLLDVAPGMTYGQMEVLDRAQSSVFLRR